MLVTKRLLKFRLWGSREWKVIHSEMKRAKHNFLEKECRPHAHTPPLSPHLPSFFIIDTSLLFDLCTPLFRLPRCQGRMASSESSSSWPPSAASPSGSASWITLISQVLHYQPSLHILLQVINAQTREPVPSAALSVKFQGPGPSRGSAPCPGREGITFRP